MIVAAFIILEILCVGWIKPVLGQESFYKNKTIRLIVGTDAGGGFDTYSRAIARHMSKHIPGAPTIVLPAGVKLQSVPDDLTYEALLQRIFDSDRVITW